METKNETNEDTNSNNAQSTGNNKSSSPITLSELSRRIHCPMNYKKKLPFMESIPKEATLSHIPWKLVVIQPNSSNDVNNENNETSSKEENNIFFPSCSYLDLRRQQNASWATNKYKEGMEWQTIDDSKAEAAFLQGLDLVPDHVNLLVAYGQLLTRKGNSSTLMDDWTLAEEKLKRALEMEPNHEIAQKALRLLQYKRQGLVSAQSRKTKAVSKELTLNHSRSAYNDVLMERSLATGNGGYDLIESDHEQEKSNDDALDRKRSSHKKRERRRSKSSKKKKRRRRRYSSSSASSSLVESSIGDNNSLISVDGEDDNASDSDYSRRRRRKKRKDKKKRKRHERKYHSKKKRRKRRNDEQEEEECDDNDNYDREGGKEDKKEEEREGNVVS